VRSGVGHLAKTGLTVLVDGASSAVVEETWRASSAVVEETWRVQSRGLLKAKTENEVDADEREREGGGGGKGKSVVGVQGADNGGCSKQSADNGGCISASWSASNTSRLSLSSTNRQEEVVLKVSVVRLSESVFLTGFAESRI